MKGRFLKKLAALLCVAFIGAAFLPACGSDVAPVKKTTFTGTHDFTAPDTEDYLVKNGSTEYKIVYNAENMSESKTACDEFIHLFAKATGKTMQKVPDTGLTHTENAKYISIGNTDLFESSGLTVDKKALGTDGVRIITKDKTVYLLGGGTDGITYSVYTFMAITFGFETYAYNCTQIEENVTEKKLKAYDVTDIPDLATRCVGNGTVSATRIDYDESMYRSRSRQIGGTTRYIMPIHSEFDNKSSAQNRFHNVENYMKPGQEGTRAEWFASEGGQQLCYTAGGNAESLAAMIDYCARKVISSLKMYPPSVNPDFNVVTITIMDNNSVCACDACMNFYKQCGGASAGPVIPFVNGMNKIVREWMAQEENAKYRRDDFKIIFFAYNTMVQPPVGDMKNGEYQPYVVNGKTLTLDEGTGIWYVPSFDRPTSIYDPKDKTKVMFEKWASITDYIAIWTYTHDYTAYLHFFDTFSHFTPELYQFYAANDVGFYYPQGWFDSKNASAWKTLVTYLDMKLSWNSSLSVEELMDNYFKAMYKEAAPAMRSMFEAVRLQWQKGNAAGLKMTQSKDAYPFQTLKAWMQICDDSIALIEELYAESNPKICQMVVDNIELEWLSPAYITSQYYFSTSGGISPLSNVEEATIRQRFNEIKKRLNVTHVKENQVLTDL